ncbi:MAG TPA: S9 family peptidase [Candidatus Tumulicola sp.]|nr:S9 family peptidase [Candidatus Tumulicola sp.]
MKPPCIAALAALAALCAGAPAGAARPVVPEDLFKLTLLDNASLAPDATHALVSVSKADGRNDTYDRTIALIDVAHASTTFDATGRKGDGDYAWMPDGKSFVFVRTLPKRKPQLYRYVLATRRVVQLTHIAAGVSSPVVSHAGKYIALSVDDPDPAPPAYVDFAKAGFAPKASQKKSDIRTIDQLFFEVNGQGYVYRDHPHIWIVDSGGGHAKQITSGKWAETFDAWSPDDRRIAFNSLRYDAVDSGPSDVYTVDASGGTPVKMASEQPGNYGLFFNGDGTRIYSLRAGVRDSAELPALVSAALDGGDARTIVPHDQLSWGDSLLADMKEGGGLCMEPLPGTQRALLNLDGPGYANLRTIDLQAGAVTGLTPARGEAWSCSLSRDGKTAAYLYSDFTHPADVYVADLESGATRRLTHVNDAYLAGVKLSQPQEFSAKDPVGKSVQAWFMPAVAGGTSRKRPTLLDIHGGPETQFGDTFFMEFQYYTSLGYNVVFSDPAGSTGHGYPFEEALESDYGDAMFQDVEAVMNAAVTRPDVDPARLGVTGGSYGGYATLWVISHTDRYKAAVAERVVSFLQSENLSADFAGKNGLGGGYYTWGPPWDPASTDYAKFSPLTYVANVRTPLLILHSEDDTRTPIDQTLQEFTALKILGRTVEYVAVPNETHDLSRTGSPIHRVERLHIVADWLNRYLHPNI